jgi:WD40 repeat protein
VWDVHTGNELLKLQGHNNWVRDGFFHPNGKFVITCSDDRTIRVWSVQTGFCVKTIHDAHSHFVTTVSMNLKIPLLASGSVDQIVKIFECK